MKNKILLFVLSVLLLSAMAVPSMCQLTVGINVGDWFEYEGTLVSWVADSGVPFPPNEYALILEEYNTTDWFRYTVTDIVDDEVTFEILTHWSNGTETTSTLVDNMATSFTMMVIGANLTEGYQIRPEYDWEPDIGFPLVWPARILDPPIMLDVNNETRETNVLDWVHPPDFGYTHQIYNWDKETGIQVYYEVQSSATDYVSGGDYSYTAKFELVDSSYGIVIPDLTGIVMLSALIAITVLIILLRPKKSKN